VDIIESLRVKAEDKRDEMVALQGLLTSIPAIAPESGGTGEWDKAQALIAQLPRLGFSEHRLYCSPDARVPGGKRPNIVVTLPGATDERTFWIMTHLDVVPPGACGARIPSVWRLTAAC
jgi:succinyl-diaminopimelate desuccinylase